MLASGPARLCAFFLLRVAPLALLALAAGCDTAPGVSDPLGDPPRITAFTFSPQEFLLDAGAPQAEVPMQLSAAVQAASGAEVRYLVRPEFAAEPVAEGVLAATGSGQYGAAFTLTLDRGATGLYAVVVYTVGSDGREGDRATGLLRFTATALGPPVIEAVDYPETVQRPAAGQPPVPVPIVATVSDPDGLSNVARVVLRAGSTEFPLLDDGGAGSSSGDETAGDGRFTITLQVESTNAPGANTFEIQAFDRAGQASAVVPITITIE